MGALESFREYNLSALSKNFHVCEYSLFGKSSNLWIIALFYLKIQC